MVEIKCPIDYKECTACMLCSFICPSHAIEQSNDERGFAFPVIDEKKCTHCGMCVEICPNRKSIEPFDRRSRCYGLNASDVIRNESSSGGVFTLLAEYFLDNAGYVCGAAFDNNMQCSHILISSKTDLHLLRKSKYVQSNMEHVWKYLDIVITEKKMVLFTGTPCQCAAVKKKYGRFDNLYIVDILCMGVSSQHCLNKYIMEEFPNEKIKDINFRFKRDGWSQKLLLRIESNKELHTIPFNESSYFLAFLKGITNRDNCANCHYAGAMRQGDITIGDFWGINKYDKDMDDGGGTSLCLVNTARGEKIFSAVIGRAVKVKQFSIETAVAGNGTLLHPTIVNSKREKFWENYHKSSLKKNLSNLLDDSADCGIINYWYTNDHGAILTAYALQSILLDLGYSSKLINICPDSYQEKRRNGISEKFELTHLNSTYERYDTHSLPKLNEKYKYFLVGSDQVFRAEWVSDDWFLRFVELGKPKIAVAASYGTEELNVSKERKKTIAWLLNRFNAVSVREKSGITLCRRLGGVRAHWILDPVLIAEKRYYVSLIEQMDKFRFLFCYIRDMDEAIKLQIEKFAEDKKCRIIYSDDKLQVEKFLTFLYNAAYVITDSYHGLCLSLVFNKSVFCYYNKKRGNARFDSIIEQLQLPKEMFITEHSTELRYVTPLSEYEKINRLMNERKRESLNWIQTNLETTKKINKLKVMFYKMKQCGGGRFAKCVTRKCVQLIKRLCAKG